MSFPRYPAYKNSGIKWLGEVPEHWEAVPLWTLFRRTKRTGFPDEELLSVYRDYGVVPKASRDDNFNNASEDLTSYQLVEPRCLAINKMKAWQGSVGISRYRGIVSPAYFIYEPLHDCSSEYLHYLLRSLEYTAAYRMVSKGIRVNQWDLDPQYHSRLPVLLPPKAEQSAIAAFLDRETGKIDALVAEQEKMIGLLKEKRQAVISHAVTKGLDPSAPMKDSGIPWLGKVPKAWSLVTLKRLAKIKYGIGEPPKYNEKGTPLIRATNVNAGSITNSGMVFVDPNDIPVQRIVWLSPGDIIVVRSGAYTGDSAIIQDEHCPCIAGFDMVVRPVGCLSNFLQYALLSWYLKNNQIDLEKLRAAQPHLNAEELGSCFILVPSTEEQSAIAAFLDEQTAKFDTLTAEAQRAIALLKEHRSALISAAVTGKIDVRNCVALQEVA